MRSLRGRLTLGVALVVAVVLLAAGAVASHYVASSERAALDDRLERTAELSRITALAAVNDELPDNDKRLDAVLSATGTSLRLTLGGRVLLDTGAPPPARPRLRRGLQTFESGGQRYRAYVTPLRDPGLGGLARLEVVSGLAPLEHRQSRLEHRLLALGLIALVAAGAGVWLAADLVLRPLRRLRSVASSVAEDEDLDRRVPPGGPTELRSLAASFNAMLARLGRSAADRRRALAATRRFTADAGHELRTPLTSVQATLSTLERHLDLPAERRAEMLGDALAEQRRLVELLDGLQALARGDAGPLELTEVDLAEVVDAVAAAALERHPGLRLTADLPEAPVAMRGWEPGLRLLADNLVENAVRHGRSGGQIRVTLDAEHPGADGGALLTVDDDGPGIPDADRTRIFAPFARLESTNGEGSGLGLALVEQQVRHHGARIDVGESPLGGARFSVRFAASAAPPTV
ncbi:MAG TPA: HAMP domain-containing sensor histidine kinase [Solirubrobacteraceae bacterium]|nr:HAMP domain-containing sensor histidine kinase [Solirubrobacteraceae bacterium]